VDNKTLLIIGLLVVLYFKSKKRRRGGAMTQPAKPDAKPKTQAPKIKAPKISGFTQYRELLAQKESAGKYDARRPNSKYWGRYQLGPLARRVGGAAGVKWAKFSKDKTLQDNAVRLWTARLYNELLAVPDARAAIGKTLHGEKVTPAFLVAMDHLRGRAATMKWIRTGKSTADGNGVLNTKFAKDFRNFDLSELKQGTA